MWAKPRMAAVKIDLNSFRYILNQALIRKLGKWRNQG